MNAAEFDALLRQFLIDGKLSAAERDSLADWVGKNVVTEQHRAVARSRVFEAARRAADGLNAVAVISFAEDVLKVLLPMAAASIATSGDDARFTPGDACLSLIVNRLTHAERTIDICVFTITDDRISNEILAAHARGVRIRIVTDNEKAYDLGSDVPRFKAAGIPLKVDDSPFHMHHKFAIFDGHRLLNGSYNWTRGAAKQNLENVVESRDANLITIFQNEFDAIWAKLN